MFLVQYEASSSVSCTPMQRLGFGGASSIYAGWDTIQVAQALEVIQEGNGREGALLYKAGQSTKTPHSTFFIFIPTRAMWQR